MTSALVASAGAPGVPPLQADLESVGIHVLGNAERGTMVQEAIRHAPDLVVCFDSHPDDALFESTAALNAMNAMPVVIFTSDPDVEKIEQATRSGVHAYVVNGYGLQRLRSVIHVAQSRFRHEQTLRQALSDLNHRFDERKLVDRAKGILMRARQISEEDAFRLLRSAAMHGKQRVGQVSRQVIDSARYAEAVNRSGQLRMLSQRLVKLYALLCAKVLAEETGRWMDESIRRVNDNIASLERSLSLPTFGDLLEAVLEPWRRLEQALVNTPDLSRMAEVDALAEALLAQAEKLTATLENAGLASTLRVINVSGRQRMLSQRLAKQVLMGSLLRLSDSETAGRLAEATQAAFVEALEFLNGLPLMSREIRQELDGASTAWKSLQLALGRCRSAAGKAEVARESETLLAHFDRLTDHYERSMQTLMG